MDREIMGKALDYLIPGDSTEIDEATLGMLFAPGEAAGVIDERTRSAATRFARDHGCRFLFDGQSSRSTFLKLPGRWHYWSDRAAETETPSAARAIAAAVYRGIIAASYSGLPLIRPTILQRQRAKISCRFPGKGHWRTLSRIRSMSALSPKADID
jgi:hypothetical protein